jgi:hypothetical protein
MGRSLRLLRLEPRRHTGPEPPREGKAAREGGHPGWNRFNLNGLIFWPLKFGLVGSEQGQGRRLER